MQRFMAKESWYIYESNLNNIFKRYIVYISHNMQSIRTEIWYLLENYERYAEYKGLWNRAVAIDNFSIV